MRSALRLRPMLIALAALGLLLGVAGVAIAVATNQSVAVPALSIPLALISAWFWVGIGLFAWWRRPDNSFGLWMVVTGFAWLAQFMVFSNWASVFIAGIFVTALNSVPLVNTLVRFPTGRVETRVERWIIRGVWGIFIFLMLTIPFSHSEDWGLERAPDNPLLVTSAPAVVVAIGIIVNATAVGLVILLTRSFINKYRSATPPGRRLLGPVLWTSTALLSLVGLTSLLAVAGLEDAAETTGILGAAAAVTVPGAYLFGLWHSKLIRGEALGLMLEQVANETDPARMRTAVAAALGDPSVELAFWLPQSDRYVSATGLPVDLPDPESGRAVAEVMADGRKVAAIIHDAALLEEPEKVEAVSRGAALAFENVRLEAELRATVSEVRASRARIVEAADAARVELERNLHDGAQQNLVSLALKLQIARAQVRSDPTAAIETIDGASAELEQTLAELRELARGIHPAVLSDRGLDAALLALAHRAPLPVEVQETPKDRLPEPIEAAAYYVVAESLTNVARYAEASRAEILIMIEGGTVRIRVTDDGVGGADMNGGSGLSGLFDRVEALDGNLEVKSPPGTGTVVEARIPCA